MNQRNQQISSLLDDDSRDIDVASFMQDLKRDTVAEAETLNRYQMIGDAMRNELNQTSFMDISAAVHRAVEDEESYSRVAAPLKPKSTFSLSAWLRPLSGLAIAASVAMITVVTYKTINTESANDKLQPIAEVSSPPAALIRSVNQQFAQHVHVASTAADQPSAEQNERLNKYLINHAGQSSMQGVMPYVRLINVPEKAAQ